MRTQSSDPAERGIVLLLALVALLLISAVAASLLYMTATESTLVGYQRSNTRVFNAARGGLEEVRARLRVSDPSFFGNWLTRQIDFPGQPGPLPAPQHVLYILNPGTGETIQPWVAGNTFYDWEYVREFGVNIETIAPCSPPPIVSPPTAPPAPPAGSCGWAINSDLANPTGPFAGLIMPEITYKWVRVTLLTEQAAMRDVDGDGVRDNTIPIVWDYKTNLMNINVDPSLDEDASGVVELDERIGRAVYRITALARHASTGATRMVQYDVSGPRIIADYPAAITLAGAGSSCGASVGMIESPPGSGNYSARPQPANVYTDPMDGDNCSTCESAGAWTKKYARSSTSGVDGTDEAGAEPGGPAIGCTDAATCWDCLCEIRGSASAMTVPDECKYGGIPANGPAFQGSNTLGQYACPAGTGAACLGDVSGELTDLDETSEYEDMITMIRDNADVVVPAGDPPPQNDGDPANNEVNVAGVTNWGNCDDTVSPPIINPKIIVLDGDATLDAGQSGCGVLLTTGDLTSLGGWEWKGVVLVIGEGSYGVMGGGAGGVRGATFVSRIYCDEGSHGAIVDPADTVLGADGLPLTVPDTNTAEAGPCPCNPGDADCDATRPGVLAAPTGASMRISGGGSIGLQYNSFWINAVTGNTRYRVLAYREMGR